MCIGCGLTRNPSVRDRGKESEAEDRQMNRKRRGRGLWNLFRENAKIF